MILCDTSLSFFFSLVSLSFYSLYIVRFHVFFFHLKHCKMGGDLYLIDLLYDILGVALVGGCFYFCLLSE